MYKRLSQAFSWLMIVAFALVALPIQNVQAISPDIVISQVYGGGGNAGAVYTHDFIELFNRGTTTVSLAGWSVQYASATGTGNFGATTTQITPLSQSFMKPLAQVTSLLSHKPRPLITRKDNSARCTRHAEKSNMNAIVRCVSIMMLGPAISAWIIPA